MVNSKSAGCWLQLEGATERQAAGCNHVQAGTAQAQQAASVCYALTHGHLCLSASCDSCWTALHGLQNTAAFPSCRRAPRAERLGGRTGPGWHSCHPANTPRAACRPATAAAALRRPPRRPCWGSCRGTCLVLCWVSRAWAAAPARRRPARWHLRRPCAQIVQARTRGRPPQAPGGSSDGGDCRYAQRGGRGHQRDRHVRRHQRDRHVRRHPARPPPHAPAPAAGCLKAWQVHL